jgi:hypothetical protein
MDSAHTELGTRICTSFCHNAVDAAKEQLECAAIARPQQPLTW